MKIEPNTLPTLTIFRKFRDGEIIALFPYLPHDAAGLHCVSYMHMGQHGGADTSIVCITKPASPSEHAPLKRELESLGYLIEARQRIPSDAYRVRSSSLRK